MYAALDTSHKIDLDRDQSAALHSFIRDLDCVLAEAGVPVRYCRSVVRALGSAYHAALGARNWAFFIGMLCSVLDELEEDGHAPRVHAASEFWRLRAVVRENADLLPPEMLKIG